MTKLAGVIVSLLAIGAGIYMLSYSTATNSIFNVLTHGIGVYFIGKGLFMGMSLWKQDEAADRLGRLVDFAAARHVRDTAEAGGDDFSGLPPA